MKLQQSVEDGDVDLIKWKTIYIILKQFNLRELLRRLHRKSPDKLRKEKIVVVPSPSITMNFVVILLQGLHFDLKL